jgi:hypothetical protein
MTTIDSDWPDKALLSTIDRVFDEALPVWLERSTASDRPGKVQVCIDLSRTLVELASDGIKDYAQLLDRALARGSSPVKVGINDAS